MLYIVNSVAALVVHSCSYTVYDPDLGQDNPNEITIATARHFIIGYMLYTWCGGVRSEL